MTVVGTPAVPEVGASWPAIFCAERSSAPRSRTVALLEGRKPVPVLASAQVPGLEAERFPDVPVIRNVLEGVARQRSLTLPLELEKALSGPVLARLELAEDARDGLPAPGLSGEVETSCDRLVQERSSDGGIENLPRRSKNPTMSGSRCILWRGSGVVAKRRDPIGETHGPLGPRKRLLNGAAGLLGCDTTGWFGTLPCLVGGFAPPSSARAAA